MRILFAFLAFVLLTTAALAEEAPKEASKLEGTTERTSYSLGHQIGRDLQRQGVTLDREALIRGIRDAQDGTEPALDPAAVNRLLSSLKERLLLQQRERRTAESEALKQAGVDYQQAHGKKEGVRTTESGLQYEVLREGTGASPGPHDTVRVHYRGSTVEGHVFDSTYERDEPKAFRLDAVMPGWSEGIQLMREGAKYRFVIPWEIAYRSRGPLAFQTLLFEVELLEVQPTPPSLPASPKE